MAWIKDDRTPERLDRFLARRLAQSVRHVRGLIRAGQARVGGRPVRKAGTFLSGGERIEVADYVPPEQWRLMPNPELPLALHFIDDDLLVAEKPSGLPVHPLHPEERSTLANAVVARHPEVGGIGLHRLEGGCVHRLDPETSGLLVVARNPESYAAMRKAFHGSEVEKQYLAIVCGAPVPPEGDIQASIVPGVKRVRCVEAGGGRLPRSALSALSRYRVLERLHGGSLVEVEARTGRRHQVRAHLACIGCPLLADELYGGVSCPGAERFFLHASMLRFRHPRNGTPLSFRSEAPEPFTRMLARLRQGDPAGEAPA